MRRRPQQLTEQEFDLLVIGGGAFGAAAARDAALRGLSVALIEQGDLGGGASAECFKMVHGGIRYLQHAEVRRVRAACAERSALLRIAPHLVRPLPIVVPTYGRGMRGKFLLGAGLHVYNALTRKRNAGIADPSRRISDGRLIGREEVLQLFPEVATPDLTGAAVFEDGQMYHPARLVLAFVKSAVAAGAVACNYVQAVDYLRSGSNIRGARVFDRLDSHRFDIRARLVLNAAGPWTDRLLSTSRVLRKATRNAYSRDAYVILARRPRHKFGLALPGSTRDSDALISRSTRHLFLVPWREYTMLGVWHRNFTAHPETACVEREEVRNWIAEINAACPALELNENEVSFTHCAPVLFGDKALAGETLSFGKHSRLIDHRVVDGINGIVSIVGIRFTNARGDAARALDLLLSQHPNPPRRAATERLPLPGGVIPSFEQLQSEALRTLGSRIKPRSLAALLHNHGTDYRAVLGPGGRNDGASVSGTETLLAEVTYAVQEECAVHLEDVVLRRTDMGNAHHPGKPALLQTAAHMGHLLKWSAQRCADEVAACEHTLQRHVAPNCERRRSAS